MDEKRLVLCVKKGERVNLYMQTPHGLKRLGAVKSMGRERLAFEFGEEVRIVREKVDQHAKGELP